MSNQGTTRAVSGGVGNGRKLVGSLLHGLSILDMFTEARSEISIGEMADQLDVHKSSASRLAATLAHVNYLELTDSQGVYRLGSRIARLGRMTHGSADLVETVTPHLRRLVDQTGETGHLAVLDGVNALTLSVIEGWHTIRMHSWVGKSLPAYLSSMGKALLAGLTDAEVSELFDAHEFLPSTEHTLGSIVDICRDNERIRQRGYGYDDEELEIGMRCVSAPIIDGTDRIVASISVSGPVQRITPESVPDVAEWVRWYAMTASRALGSATGTPEGWKKLGLSAPEPLEYVELVRRG